MRSSRSLVMSSRLRRVDDECHPWITPGGHALELPVLLDHRITDRATGKLLAVTEARLDLVNGTPALVSVTVSAPGGLGVDLLQTSFRWATPLEVVTITVPQLLAAGLDPFAHDYATDGYPQAAYQGRRAHSRLTDEFLEQIALRYLVIGRGYARRLAEEHHVSARTIVSWVEQARRRGILSATTPGTHGGRVIPAEERQPQAD